MAKKSKRKITIKLNGYFTADKNAKEVEEKIEEIESSDPRMVIFDMENVTFMDSSAIIYLIRLSKMCRKRQIFFAVINCRKVVKDLLMNLRLDFEFPVA
jgi:anti-anti-sigma factor